MSKGEIGVYRRHRPESTTLYEVVRDNIETLFGAIDDGGLAVRIPKHARQELVAYLDCGLLCRGFARLKCRGCSETRLVAFSCKGRGFCPSCMGRRMCATAANLVERVLPPSTPLRQWVLTFPFPWRPRLAQDGELLGRLTQIFVETVQAFYVRRAAQEGAMGAKTGAVTAVQRASSDMRLNPHLHTIALDGVWSEQGNELVFSCLGHLKTSEVGEVLEQVVRRIERRLDRRGLLGTKEDDLDLSGEGDPESNLATSAVSGQSPPAGPQWSAGLQPLRPRALAYDKPLCASLDGFTLHAAIREGGLDAEGREALLRYVPRGPRRGFALARYLAAAGELTEVARTLATSRSALLEEPGAEATAQTSAQPPLGGRGSVASGREAREIPPQLQSLAHGGNLGAPQPLGSGAKRARHAYLRISGTKMK